MAVPVVTPVGITAVHDVALTKVAVAATPPNVRVTGAAVKLVPLSVTVPPIGWLAGVTLVKVGVPVAVTVRTLVVD
jgi:ABC-type proline/glycine betaine transport system permease subunit